LNGCEILDFDSVGTLHIYSACCCINASLDGCPARATDRTAVMFSIATALAPCTHARHAAGLNTSLDCFPARSTQPICNLRIDLDVRVDCAAIECVHVSQCSVFRAET